MDKRAQIGKIITTFPVVISIFIIMAGFIALSFAGRVILAPESIRGSVPSFVKSSYLNGEIGSFSLPNRYVLIDGGKKRIADVLIDMKDSARESDEFIVALIEAEKNFGEKFEKGQCLLLYTSEMSVPIFLFGNKGEMRQSIDDSSMYYSHENCKRILVEPNKKIVYEGNVKIESYYGSCFKKIAEIDIFNCEEELKNG